MEIVHNELVRKEIGRTIHIKHKGQLLELYVWEKYDEMGIECEHEWEFDCDESREYWETLDEDTQDEIDAFIMAIKL